MKRRIEHGHLGHVRKQFLTRLDPFEVRGIVQGRKPGAFFDGVLYLVVDLHRLAEMFAPVNDTVPDRFDVNQVLDAAVGGVRDKFVQNDAYRLFVIGDAPLSAKLRLSLRLEHDLRIREAHAFNRAPCQLLRLSASPEEAVFHRRRAAIQHKNDHQVYSSSWETRTAPHQLILGAFAREINGGNRRISGGDARKRVTRWTEWTGRNPLPQRRNRTQRLKNPSPTTWARMVAPRLGLSKQLRAMTASAKGRA